VSIEDEVRVRAAAAEVYRPEGVDIWYDAPNRLLNNASPRQFVEAGDADRVLEVLDQLASGSFS
jgi:hypothetical protein